MLHPLHLEVRREQVASRAAADNLVRAAQTNDVELLYAALPVLQFDCWNGWKRALTKAKTCSVHPDFRLTFLALWEEQGDTLRSSINDDLVLINLLRLFLPPYTGPSVELYRGETAWNRRKRTYGPSWSADREAATCYATLTAVTLRSPTVQTAP